MGISDTKTLAEFVADVVEQNGAERSKLAAILHEVQREYNYLPEQALRDIAVLMEIPMTDVYGVATFYTSFSLVPKGRHIVTVCMGTACHVRNSRGILDEICRFLGISPGETTEDMAFSLETVNCLGACAMGPIMVVDGKYFGEMTGTRVGRILKSTRKTRSPRCLRQRGSPPHLSWTNTAKRSSRRGTRALPACASAPARDARPVVARTFSKP